MSTLLVLDPTVVARCKAKRVWACSSKARPLSSKRSTCSLLRWHEILSFSTVLPLLYTTGFAWDSRNRSKIHSNSVHISSCTSLLRCVCTSLLLNEPHNTGWRCLEHVSELLWALGQVPSAVVLARLRVSLAEPASITWHSSVPVMCSHQNSPPLWGKILPFCVFKDGWRSLLCPALGEHRWKHASYQQSRVQMHGSITL